MSYKVGNQLHSDEAPYLKSKVMHAAGSFRKRWVKHIERIKEKEQAFGFSRIT
jgi:hypothetical protein